MAVQATPLFDRLVFSKVKERLGGRVKLIVSGGAPLAGKTLHPAHPIVSPHTGARCHVPLSCRERHCTG